MAVKKYLDLEGLKAYHGLLETNYLNGVADIIKNTAASGDPVYEIKTGATLVASPSAGDNTTKIATTAYVQGEIAGIATPMIFKGTADGALPTGTTGSPIKVGYTYKVITSDIANVPTGSGTPETAKVGDTIICTTADISTGTATYWSVIPSGDEPSGTVTGITIADDASGSGTSDAITASNVAKDGTVTLTVNKATDSAFGVVKTGTNITNTNGVISVATADASTLGVVSIGDNIDVSNGEISVPTADASSTQDGKFGVVKTGTNITNTSGVIDVNVATAGTSTDGTKGIVTTKGDTSALKIESGSIGVKLKSETISTVDTTSLGIDSDGLYVDTITYSGTGNDISALFA